MLGGLSRNQAAARFKVSVASAVRWVKRFKTTGEISPTPRGRTALRPDRGASRLSLGPDPAQADITLLEIKEQLIGNCGERFAVSVLWRFFDVTRSP